MRYAASVRRLKLSCSRWLSTFRPILPASDVQHLPAGGSPEVRRRFAGGSPEVLSSPIFLSNMYSFLISCSVASDRSRAQLSQRDNASIISSRDIFFIFLISIFTQ